MECFIQCMHDCNRKGFMMHSFNKYFFKRMRVWTMTDIMQQDRCFSTSFFFGTDLNSFIPEFTECVGHQVISSQGMVKPCMYCSGINQLGKCHLVNTA